MLQPERKLLYEKQKKKKLLKRKQKSGRALKDSKKAFTSFHRYQKKKNPY